MGVQAIAGPLRKADMIYNELIAQLAEETKYTKREIRTILRQAAKLVTAALVSGQKVYWHSIGSFHNVSQRAYHVRNYKTGERYWTIPRRRVKFTPSIPLRNKVRQSIVLFQEPETTQQYLPKKVPNEHGQVRSGDRSREGGEREDSRKEPTKQSQRQHPSRSG